MFKAALVGFGRTGKIVADEIFRQKNVDIVAVFKNTDDVGLGLDIGKAKPVKRQES